MMHLSPTPVFAFAIAMLLLCGGSAHAQSADTVTAEDNPPMPALESTSERVRVALVDSGINYLLPEIASRLATSPEGELIGFDFRDMDELPFDNHPTRSGRVLRHGTRTASILLHEAPNAALVPYRYPGGNMHRMRELIEHAAANDVAVIGMPLGGNRREPWLTFYEVAKAHPHILFVVSAGNNGHNIDTQPVYPASFDLANMLVVTSANDFGMVAEGVNWGRTSVDYMVPAEHRQVLEFDGSAGYASGSSYAVPRVVATVARLLERNPTYTTDDILSWFRKYYANGASPKFIGQGYLADPLFDEQLSIEETHSENFTPRAAPETTGDTLHIPVDVFVLNEHWPIQRVHTMLEDAAAIIAQCNFLMDPIHISYHTVPDYLQHLDTGASHTLMNAIRRSGPERRTTVVLADDTRMENAFDGEAFGKGNTRFRSWLSDSVWLTRQIQDEAIALAHELFHVLANSGQHVEVAGNLMLARTTGSNTGLSEGQCERAREVGLGNGLVR